MSCHPASRPEQHQQAHRTASESTVSRLCLRLCRCLRLCLCLCLCRPTSAVPPPLHSALCRCLSLCRCRSRWTLGDGDLCGLVDGGEVGGGVVVAGDRADFRALAEVRGRGAVLPTSQPEVIRAILMDRSPYLLSALAEVRRHQRTTGLGGSPSCVRPYRRGGSARRKTRRAQGWEGGSREQAPSVCSVHIHLAPLCCPTTCAACLLCCPVLSTHLVRAL